MGHVTDWAPVWSGPGIEVAVVPRPPAQLTHDHQRRGHGIRAKREAIREANRQWSWGNGNHDGSPDATAAAGFNLAQVAPATGAPQL